MTQGQDPGGEVSRGKDDPGKGLHKHKIAFSGHPKKSLFPVQQ